MRALLKRRDGIIRVAFRIGGNAGQIGLQFLQCFMEGRMDFIACQFIGHGNLGAIDETNNLEAGIAVIGERMAAAHIAEAGGKNTNRILHCRTHFTAPAVMPRISCREKMT